MPQRSFALALKWLALTAAAIGALFALNSCGEITCEDFQTGDIADEIERFKQACECDFELICTEDLEGGTHGLTTYNYTDRTITIRLRQEATIDELRHELVHALDFCFRFSHFEVFDTDGSTPAHLIAGYYATMLAELIAYRKIPLDHMQGENNAPNPSGQFANPDNEDAALVLGALAYIQYLQELVASGQLSQAMFDAILKNIRGTDIPGGGPNNHPESFGDNNPDYQRLKERLINKADEFAKRNKACCDVISEIAAELE